MFRQPTSVIYTILLLAYLLLAACSGPGSPATGSPTSSASRTTTADVRAAATSTAAPTSAPEHFTARTLLQGGVRPDDLVFDNQGHLLFSDFYSGTISRVNSNKTATPVVRGIAGPEGLVVLANGTMIIAEQRTNRILSLASAAHTPTVLRRLPGVPSAAPCKDGVDGIAFDATTNTIIVSDSPTGAVYRLSLDGKTLTLLASGIPRPVGATVDRQGNVYVADECGGALWRITPGGLITRTGGFGMLDDVAIDPYGNLLVIDLQPSIHALIRMNPVSGRRETLASRGYIEPQGLLVDGKDTIYVSDDYADIIVEYTPA